MRQFTSEPLDKPWFYDREMWPQYLTMLAAQRFNRFHLAFGLGYDVLNRVADSYLLFLYPFLLAVPGYNVRATNLPDAERDRNLETLRYISEQTVGARPGVSIGYLDARVPLADQSASPKPHRRAERRNSRVLLPRRADGGVEGLPRYFRGGAAHSRRERYRRRKLRFLADGFRWRETLRPTGGDRPARQGHRSDHDRWRPGHRHAC